MVEGRIPHAYVVPAYGDSPFIWECLESLKAQSTISPIIISTSTPSSFLENIAMQYGVDYYVHSPNKGIGHDWNRALNVVESDWITLAHQDDVYYKDYGLKVISAAKEHPDSEIIFTNYAEIVDGYPVNKNTLLRLKKLLLNIGFLGREAIHRPFSKRNCLRFACPIPCPAVTIRNSGALLFNTDLALNLDWDAWLRLSNSEGSFLWIKETLMGHRIHSNSETVSGIRSGARQIEDIMLLKLFWPELVANLISKSYRFAYRRGESS